jgi:hypothetical protein
VLARLQRLKPAPTVEFDRSGTLLRLTPASAAKRVQAELRATGAKTRLLTASEAAKATANVGSWYSRSNVRELSREEYRTLARQWSAELKEDAGLSDDQERRLVASFDGAIDEAVATLGPDGPADRETWRALKIKARERVLEESASYLSASQVDQVREVLSWGLR